jgi:hypothetical protein
MHVEQHLEIHRVPQKGYYLTYAVLIPSRLARSTSLHTHTTARLPMTPKALLH